MSILIAIKPFLMAGQHVTRAQVIDTEHGHTLTAQRQKQLITQRYLRLAEPQEIPTAMFDAAQNAGQEVVQRDRPGRRENVAQPKTKARKRKRKTVKRATKRARPRKGASTPMAAT
jgi:hypothetical protein